MKTLKRLFVKFDTAFWARHKKIGLALFGDNWTKVNY
jgi:hypothetical protein